MKITGAVLEGMGRPRPFADSRPITVSTLDLSEPGPTEILVKLEAAGLCHSDLSVVDGSRVRPLPMLLGHEAAGTVVEIDGVGHPSFLAKKRQILFNPGAIDAAAFARFLNVVQQYNASGERFRIDGHCQSACTMFLSIRNVCVAPGATLLFHAGGSMRTGTINPASTQKMLSTYNAALRQYVTDNHFMDTLAFHSIPGSQIIKRFGYPACR